jgi:hypothetical protein
MVGWLHSEEAATSLTDVTKKSKGLEPRLLEMAQMLAR